MAKYVDMFMSEDMIGDDGILGEIGLIALPSDRRTALKKFVSKRVKITLEELTNQH